MTRLHPLRRFAVLALVLAACLWGTSFLFGKLALSELSVSQVILYRFTFASLVVLPIALTRRIWPRPHDLLLFLLTGVLTVPVTFIVQFEGLKHTSAAMAALIIGVLPPLLALAARIFYREKLSARCWGAMGLSCLGVLLVVGIPSSGNNWLGDGLIFLSLFAVVAWTLLGKRLSHAYSPMGAIAYIFSLGTLTVLPISLYWDGLPRLNLSVEAWIVVAFLGVVCSVTTMALWDWGLQYFPASRAGIYLNLETLVGVILGVTLLHEEVSPLALVGGVFILAAAIIISRRETSA